MKILFLNLFFSFLLLPALLFGQISEDKALLLTGRLNTDSKIILNNYEQQQRVFSDELPGRKTPVLSGILSAIIPGAGQFYNEDYWIAGIFLAAEAALITVGVIYDNKAAEQTASFEKYADENWSVVDYAKWMNNHRNTSITIDETTPGLEPWERVNWAELKIAEDAQSDFSHNLRSYGEQQYYEMIGKYHQFAPGWNDFPPNQSSTDPISLNFTFYSGERGKANDYFNIAGKAVIGIYINHLLSAVEAVWGATRFNNNLAINIRVKSINLANKIELVPTLNFRYSF
jgi:hypothetical protein